ncbi:MAG: hypothetical protein ACXAC5_02450 [Promethearchaeota archaeon]|jgi:hypothetical protein
MCLRWDYLFGAIVFFALFLFEPLLKAVGPQSTTIIICVGLIGIAIIKAMEYDHLRP